MTLGNVKALLSVQPNFCTAFVIMHLVLGFATFM